MEPTNDKMETFFRAVANLITSGILTKGKDYKLVEEANGKVLYLHVESIYSHYKALLGDSSLSIIDLRTYLKSSSVFVKYIKTQFLWNEPINESAYKKHAASVCAVMLCYDTLSEKYNIDMERYSIEEFEAAILAKGLSVDDIDGIKLKGKFVHMAIGYMHNKKYTWNDKGKCFLKNGTPNRRYDLKFE